MKKILTVILSVAMLYVTAICASAENPITTAGGTDSAAVKATYTPGGTSPSVFSVDIVWGSMEFTYTGESAGTWNPKNHSYDGKKAAAWSCADGENVIKVTNHSNSETTAVMEYTPETEYGGISGTFSDSEIMLESAVGTEVENAPSGSSKLTLSGELSDKSALSKSIGTVTVKIRN